jgi:curli biogenesis system outer membrane secretion channel CsgG
MIKKLMIRAAILYFIINLSVPNAIANNLSDGLDSFNNQDYNKAVIFLKKAVKENPDDPEPHKWLAKCYTELFMLDLSLKEMDLVKKLEDKKAFLNRNIVKEEIKKEPSVKDNRPSIVNIVINGSNSLSNNKYTGKKKIKLAVLDFKSKHPYYYDNENKLTQTITEYLTSNILNSGLQVLERSQIDEIIKELEFEKSEFVLSSSAKKIGKLYGLDYLLLGYVLDFSRDVKTISYPKQPKIYKKVALIRINAKLINIETGEIEFSEVLSDSNENKSYEYDQVTEFELEDNLMSSISKRISKKLVEKLNSKFSK